MTHKKRMLIITIALGTIAINLDFYYQASGAIMIIAGFLVLPVFNLVYYYFTKDKL